jgi:hypothetical protein
MVFDERLGHADERPGLRAEEAGRVNLRLELLGGRVRERARVAISREERRRDDVDARIGGLRGQNCRDEQLERALVVELGVRVRMLCLEQVEDRSRAVFIADQD